MRTKQTASKSITSIHFICCFICFVRGNNRISAHTYTHSSKTIVETFEIGIYILYTTSIHLFVNERFFIYLRNVCIARCYKLISSSFYLSAHYVVR